MNFITVFVFVVVVSETTPPSNGATTMSPSNTTAERYTNQVLLILMVQIATQVPEAVETTIVVEGRCTFECKLIRHTVGTVSAIN